MTITAEQYKAAARKAAEAGDVATARSLIARARAAEPQTGVVQQGMSGVNEGLAGMLGMPVDLATGAVNAMVQRPVLSDEVSIGADGVPTVKISQDGMTPGIENPIGGSAAIQDMMGSAITDVQPQNMGQRFARRIGQEVGGAAVPGAAMLSAPAKAGGALSTLLSGAQSNPGRFAAVEGLSAVGAGAGAATANEVAPNSALAELLGLLLGGGATAGSIAALAPSPKAPTIDALRGRQAAAYGQVDASPTALTPDATQRLQSAVTGRAAQDGMDPFLAPKASRVAERIGTLETPSLSEVEKARRLVGRDVAGAVDPTERAIGMGMKDEITNYLDSLTPADVTGGDPTSVIPALHEGRNMTRRIKKSEDVTNRVYKAENRAATSGTGGNEVNAIRQNIRGILDDPRKRRGYSADEIAAMEDIVRGTPTQNALRLIGRFSPTAGALPAMAGVAGGTAFGPMGAIPSAVGYLAKGGAEALTQRSVAMLDEMIRNGGPLPGKEITPQIRSALAALLAAQLSGDAGNQAGQ